MSTVVCVLRSGGEFGPRDVARLADGLSQHAPSSTLVIYSDVALDTVPCRGITGIQNTLVDDWPSWWAKMELFRHPGPVLYLDLDTVIVGDLAPLFAAVESLPRDRLMMLRNFYDERCGSGVMGWSGDMRWLTEAFERALAGDFVFEQRGQRTYLVAGTKAYRGDQEWITRAVLDSGRFISIAQDLCDGIVSYKVGMQAKNLRTPPPGTRLVVFHGAPRPSEIRPEPKWMARAS